MGKSSGSQTTVQKSDPWSGVQPYLIGQAGGINPETGQKMESIPGLYNEALHNYQSGGWTGQMGNLANWQQQNLSGRQGQVDQLGGAAQSVMGGAYNANPSAVQNIAGANPVNAQQVDPTQAFASMGAANPTGSIAQMLTGQVNTQTLDPVVQSAARRLGETYSEQVMPQIRGQAVAAGQYGSSRQGIAEGLASKALTNSVGDMSANMYNNAYNTAQSNMYGTANNMAGLGLNSANQNANRDLAAQTTNASNSLNTQQFNANLGLQNNSQAMQASNQNLQNLLQGANLMGTSNALQDNNYSQMMSLLQSPNAYNQSNLNNYANLINSGAGAGGTSTSQTPTSSNPIASGLGGALAGAQLAGLTGGLVSSGMGAGIGGALALLSDRRFKTDIERVGTLDNGLSVYRYRYKSGGPLHIGVMADEAKAMNPGAVITADGVDYVKYGEL